MIHLVCALACEARPLIHHYGLARIPKLDFPIWRGAELTLSLSGVGRRAAAAAVHKQVLFSQPPNCVPAWLNVGVAGHAQLPLGEAALIHRAIEQCSGHSWYPRVVFTPPCPEQTLITVDQPSHDCPEQALYDMEGTGFLAAALCYSPPEITHCLKIVSDHPHQPLNPRRDAPWISKLIEAQLEPLDSLLGKLKHLQAELEERHDSPPGWDRLRLRVHLSASQQIQMKRLLQQWATLLPGEQLPFNEQHPLSAAKLLSRLREQIEQRALHL